MMKGGKDEEKMMGPLFPRLHVNDTDKGGPRAPPRNKMALYEQLSIPSQRFNSPSASVLPLPPHNASTLVPSASMSQGCGHERSVFSPFYEHPHTPVHSAAQSVEKVHSRSSEGMRLNTTRNESEKRSVKNMNNNALKGTGSVADCSSHHLHEFSQTKSPCAKRFDVDDDDDDFRVPTFVQSKNAADSSKGRLSTEAETLTPFYVDSPKKGCSATADSSIQFPCSYDKPLERMNASVKKSRHSEGNLSEQRPKAVSIKEHKEKSASHLGIQEELAEPLECEKVSSDPECTNMLNTFEDSRNEGPSEYEEACGTDALGGQRCSNGGDVVRNSYVSNVRNELYSKALRRDSHRSRNATDSCNQESDYKAGGTVELRDADRNGDASDASMVESILGSEICPDDVVGVIGPKQFWKARRAIVNQQTVFALQVFELHRLIKVQKLIAASPHILLGEYPSLGRSLTKVAAKNLLAECNTKPQTQIVKHKDDSQKPSQNLECPTENTVGAIPLPSCEDGPDKGLCQAPGSMAYSGNPPPVPAASENRPSAWCFHPPANQWLVPVMSPSEGLVYKPYAGPCPPAAGFMAPVYGSCVPLSLPPACGVPAPPQQQNRGVFTGAVPIAPNYFPAPYGLPVVNSIISASAVEQVIPMVGSQPHGQIDQNSRNSCNMSNTKSEAFSGCLRRFQSSKDSEIQGSTASSPCEKAQGEGMDALPLFPMAPVAEGSTRPSESAGRDNNETRVIKVVPHNPRSATESAARIFRSIQRERQQYDT